MMDNLQKVVSVAAIMTREEYGFQEPKEDSIHLGVVANGVKVLLKTATGLPPLDSGLKVAREATIIKGQDNGFQLRQRDVGTSQNQVSG